MPIGLIYVIAQQIQKSDACTRVYACTDAIEASAKSIANWKELSSFILDIFSNLQPRRIRKNRNHQKFLLIRRYLSKVNLDFSLFPFNGIASTFEWLDW